MNRKRGRRYSSLGSMFENDSTPEQHLAPEQQQQQRGSASLQQQQHLAPQQQQQQHGSALQQQQHLAPQQQQHENASLQQQQQSEVFSQQHESVSQHRRRSQRLKRRRENTSIQEQHHQSASPTKKRKLNTNLNEDFQQLNIESENKHESDDDIFMNDMPDNVNMQGQYRTRQGDWIQSQYQPQKDCNHNEMCSAAVDPNITRPKRRKKPVIFDIAKSQSINMLMKHLRIGTAKATKLKKNLYKSDLADGTENDITEYFWELLNDLKITLNHVKQHWQQYHFEGIETMLSQGTGTPGEIC